MRRSALTTPPIRVPSISRLLLSRTAALSSKRMKRPSGLRTALRVRTITARRTSPWRTFGAEADAAPEMGRARLTTQTISSPTLPQPLLTFCLRTLTHSMRSAPELSMTWKIHARSVRCINTFRQLRTLSVPFRPIIPGEGQKERQEEGLSEIVFHDEVIDWWRRENVFYFLFE